LTDAAPAATQSRSNILETLGPAEVPSLVGQIPTIKVDAKSRPRLAGPLPERIGSYEIVEQVGQGGMGVVYKARQQGLDRFVAIKIIVAGKFADDEDIGRFRQEAEAIARLQHVNIVQIYEIGQHEGRPFLALEFVPGPSLARLSGQPQPAPVAARLVATLSRAMAHAHRRGIVHRDLTPANILLAPGDERAGANSGRLENSTPKITDFGLAKRLDSDGGQTRVGTIMGTPYYMSPEQAEGRLAAVGPRADIYALGAVLYELLTGRPPFLGETAMATLDQVVHTDPVPPSQLQPRVPRDLETICLKCLEKDPDKRYASADDLADDLARYSEHKPILARRTGPAARLWKWSKRRPSLAGLIAVSVTALVCLAIGSQWYSALVRKERNLAEENLRIALLAVDGMLTEVGEEQLAYEPRMEQKRRALLQRALALYQQFLSERQVDERLRLETAHAYRRMGDIERWLGNHRAAQDAYRAAISLFELLGHEQDEAYCWNFLGESQRLASQPPAAQSSYEKAIEIQEHLAAADPSAPDYQQELARTHYNLGILYRETNRPVKSETALRRAQEILAVLAKKHDARADYRQELARVHTNLGPVLRSTKRAGEAVEAYTQAISLLDALVLAHPDRADYRFELAVAHANRGNARAGSLEAKADYEAAQRTLSKLVVDYPSVPSFMQELANTENGLAAMLAGGDGLDEAAKLWQSASERLRPLASRPDALPAHRADLGLILGNLGWASFRQGEFEKGRSYLREGIECLEKALKANPDHPDYRASLRGQYRDLAECSLRLGDSDSASVAAKQLASARGTHPSDQFRAASLLARAGVAAEADARLADSNREERSRQHFAAATAILRQLAQTDFHDAKLLDQARVSLAAPLERSAELRASFAALEARADK
jgi:tetratricopeptide (TPR) repeat protein